MKIHIAVFALFAAPALCVSQEGAHPISLDEALSLARRNAPQMISARGQLRTSAASLRQARWAYNPFNNITFSYSSSTSGGNFFDNGGNLQTRANRSWGFSQGFGSASLTIWDGGTKLANISRSRAQVTQAEINELTQGYNIASQVKTQYYAVLRAREQLETARLQLQNAEQQMRIARVRLSTGVAVSADTLQAAIAIYQAQNSVLNGENALSNANAQLTRLTASPVTVTAIPSDTTDPPPLGLSEAELYALAEQGPSVQSARASLAVSEAQLRSSSAVRWPQVSASAGYGRSNSERSEGKFFDGYDFGAGPMSYNWNFSLRAEYRIFDGFQREASILNAKVNVDNAEANLRDAQLAARQQMTSQLNTLRTNEAQIVLARAQLAAAEENLRVVQTRYELGAATPVELTTAQQQVTSARATLANSRFDVRTARAAIEALIGRDLPQR